MISPESFFKKMYFDIWQSNNIEEIDKYYANDFKETIDTTNTHNEPLELALDYDGIVEQSQFQKENYSDTTFELKKLVASDNYISVHFYSTSLFKQTGEKRHRCVCGIWRLNKDKKIDRVWAVVTPYYE